MAGPTRHESLHARLHRGFAAPNPEYSPTPLWWWSGERVTLPRLCRQLDELARGGVHNLVVFNLAPTGPAHGALADDPPLLSEAWWELWAGLVEHAKTVGTKLWFYDQLGFSSANLQGRLIVDRPELAGRALDRRTVLVEPGREATLGCAGQGTALGASATPLRPDGVPDGPPRPIPMTGDGVTWRAPAGRRAYRLALDFSRPHGFDYLSADACRALLDVVHGEFERRLGDELGSTIIGSFQDELPSVPTWSDDFGECFARRRGYRLEPALAALWDDLEELPGERTPAHVRLDYQRTRAELAEEAFFRPLHDWHERHGMLVGCDQQGQSRAAQPLDTVRQYADYPRTHRWFSAPGSDHHGDAKIHSSLAHHYRRDRVWIEAFHSSGWGSTLEETFDWLVPWILSGATLFDPHAVYYSTRGGWFEWAPPSSCWRQPYWQHYDLFADTVSRLSWLLSQGRHVCSVGLLFPNETVQAYTLMGAVLPPARRAHESYLRLAGRMAWYEPELGSLIGAGIDFDVLDEATVAASAVGGGRLRTATEDYRAVVLPECRVLDTGVACRLVDFVESGGHVVVVGDPPEVSDSPAGSAACARLRELIGGPGVSRVAAADEVPAALAGLVEQGVAGPSLHRRVGDLDVLVVPAARLGTATSQPPVSAGHSWRDHLRTSGYDFDPARWRDHLDLDLPPGARAVEQWDPVTGTAARLPVTPTERGSRVTVSFAAAPLAVVVWGESGPSVDGRADPPPGPAGEIDVPAQWTCVLEPTTDNTFGDLALPAHPGPLPVQQWRMQHFDVDQDRWCEVLVGHGTQAWRYGPVRRDEWPDPLPPGHSGPLHGPGWQPVEYSLTRGIEKDPLYVASLGPNGRVPEEFWQVADVGADEGVVFRTALPLEAGLTGLCLAIGANADVEAWWNGRLVAVPEPVDGYLRLLPLAAAESLNTLELRIGPGENPILRGYWAIVRSAEAFRRPEWLTAARDGADGDITFRRELVLDAPVSRAVLQLATVGQARLVVNGSTVATHGSYEPYGIKTRVQPYDVTALLRPGDNMIEIIFSGSDADHLSALLDGEVTIGDHTQTLCTDHTWTTQTDRGGPAPARLERRRLLDPRYVMLRDRPHPLPRSTWLNGSTTPDDVVVDVTPSPYAGTRRSHSQTFRTVVPPGATRVRLPSVASAVTAALDGEPCTVVDDTVVLAEPARVGRSLQLTVAGSATSAGGAVWAGPLEYICDQPGAITTGDWADHGLGGYAGGITYRQAIDLPTHQSAVLDLGAVRGTVTVRVNGTEVGRRIWSPYRIELAPHSHAGTNTIEVTVFNTLAGYLDDVSPTYMVYPGQRRAGLFGPVRILTRRAQDTHQTHRPFAELSTTNQ